MSIWRSLFASGLIVGWGNRGTGGFLGLAFAYSSMVSMLFFGLSIIYFTSDLLPYAKLSRLEAFLPFSKCFSRISANSYSSWVIYLLFEME